MNRLSPSTTAPGAPGIDEVPLMGTLSPVSPRAHRGIRWASIEPSLRDRVAGGCCLRTVSCSTCSSVIGHTDDPVEAVLIALRHRWGVRTRTRGEHRVA